MDDLTAVGVKERPDSYSTKYGIPLKTPAYDSKCVDEAKTRFLVKNDPAIRKACGSLGGDEQNKCAA